MAFRNYTMLSTDNNFRFSNPNKSWSGAHGCGRALMLRPQRNTTRGDASTIVYCTGRTMSSNVSL